MKDFRYSDPKSSGAHDGFSVRVECRDPDTQLYIPLNFQGPKMRIPFGMEGKQLKDGGIKYYCPLSFPTVKKDLESGQYICDEGQEQALAFLKFLMRVDIANKAAALDKCQLWFKKKMDKNVLEEFYYHNLKIPKEEEKYSPTMTTKLRHSESAGFRTEFWNQKRLPIEYESITKGLEVIPLLTTTGLWFAGKSFGMSMQVHSIMVYERDQFNGCAIDQDEDEGGIQIDEEYIAPPPEKRAKLSEDVAQVAEFNS